MRLRASQAACVPRTLMYMHPTPSSSITLPVARGRMPCWRPRADTLALHGHVPHPRTFDLAAIRAVPRQELGPTRIDCYSGRPIACVESYAGARLVDLIDATGFSTMPRSERKRCIVVATGADGYRAIFSWCELYNAAIGDGVLVLYERDGLPLDDHLGALSLISAADRRLGPRHLRQLESVEVQRL